MKIFINYFIFLFLLNTITVQAQEARITSVKVTNKKQTYGFQVGIQSPDTGCNQYANWWEIVSPEGELLYRRILGHSHVKEQPFVRSGGAIPLAKDQVIYIRLHMNTTGYSRKGFSGSIATGFKAFELPEDFAPQLATQEPLPKGCAF